MIGITELKNGTIFEDGGQPWQVLEYNHSKQGRGGAVLKTKIKNLITGSVVDKTYKGSDKLEPVQLERRNAQYLFQEGTDYVFMDEATYDQFNLGKDVLGDAPKYIKEGESIQLQYFKGKPINIDLPVKVTLKVTEAMQADKGNTATAASKPITLETGLTINGPMFINEGDSVVVDTRTASYVERAK
jgi:elongation factor P